MKVFTNLSLKAKLWFVAGIPLFVMTILYIVVISNSLERYNNGKNGLVQIELIKKISPLVNKLQVERGMSAAYLSGNDNMDKIVAHRKVVDGLKKSVHDYSISNSMHSTNAFVRPLHDELAKLIGYRKSVDEKVAVSTHLKNYTSLIYKLLDFYRLSAKDLTSLGISPELLSLRIIEESKEKQGVLRAVMSSTIAANNRISKNKKNKIKNLRLLSTQNLHSPLIILSKQNIENIKKFAMKPHWKKVGEVYKAMMSFDGETAPTYSITSSEFFTTISKTVSDLNIVLTTELDVLRENLVHHAKVQSRKTMIGVSSAIVIVLSVIMVVFFVNRGVANNFAKLVRFVKDIGKGNLESTCDIKSKNEMGMMASELNKMAHDLKESNIETDRLIKNFKMLPAPVLEMGKDFKIKFINTAAANIGDKTPEECIGTYCYDLFKTGDCKNSGCACGRAMESNQLETSSTVACPMADTKIPIDYFGVPTHDENGNITGALEFIVDQTKIYDVAAQLQKSVSTLTDITDNISSSVKGLSNSSKSLDSVAASSSAAIEEISCSISNVADRSEKSSLEVGTVATASEEMKASMDSVSTSIEQLSSSFEEIVRNTQEATKVTDSAARSSSEISTSMSSLNEEAENIGGFVNVITGIASQTNLLALNATIEAARAGDAGKGFAVVANEVKELSKQTTDSASDISTKIDDIQNASKESSDKIGSIVSIMKTIQSQNQTVASTVEEQSAITNEITTTVKDTVHVVGEVARSIDLIRNSVEDIANSVSEVSQGMQEITRSTAGVTSSATDVSKDSFVLNTQLQDIAKLREEFEVVVNKFKLLDQL